MKKTSAISTMKIAKTEPITKLTEPEMNAALQLIQISRRDIYSTVARDNSTMNIMEETFRPKKRKFRSIASLYQCTNRLSPLEDEYNRNRSTEEEPDIMTNKKNIVGGTMKKMARPSPTAENSNIKTIKFVGCKRKRERKQQ